MEYFETNIEVMACWLSMRPGNEEGENLDLIDDEAF